MANGSALALLHSRGCPWQVVVNHPSGTVEIQPFCGHVAGDEHPGRALVYRARAEQPQHGVAVAALHPDPGVVAGAPRHPVAAQPPSQVMHRCPGGGEDQGPPAVLQQRAQPLDAGITQVARAPGPFDQLVQVTKVGQRELDRLAFIRNQRPHDHLPIHAGPVPECGARQRPAGLARVPGGLEQGSVADERSEQRGRAGCC